MENEFLTMEEIQFLTGRDKRSAQIRWLRANGWKYLLSAAGAPIVGRMYCRQKLSNETQIIDDTPNFGAVL